MSILRVINAIKMNAHLLPLFKNPLQPTWWSALGTHSTPRWASCGFGQGGGWKFLRKLTPPCSYESDPRRAAKLILQVSKRLLPINDTPAGACPHRRADAGGMDETDELFWGGRLFRPIANFQCEWWRQSIEAYPK